jgi:hypothetical protein
MSILVTILLAPLKVIMAFKWSLLTIGVIAAIFFAPYISCLFHMCPLETKYDVHFYLDIRNSFTDSLRTVKPQQILEDDILDLIVVRKVPGPSARCPYAGYEEKPYRVLVERDHIMRLFALLQEKEPELAPASQTNKYRGKYAFPECRPGDRFVRLNFLMHDFDTLRFANLIIDACRDGEEITMAARPLFAINRELEHPDELWNFLESLPAPLDHAALSPEKDAR